MENVDAISPHLMTQLIRNNNWLDIYVSKYGVRIVDVLDNHTNTLKSLTPEVADSIPRTYRSTEEEPISVTGVEKNQEIKEEEEGTFMTIVLCLVSFLRPPKLASNVKILSVPRVTHANHRYSFRVARCCRD